MGIFATHKGVRSQGKGEDWKKLKPALSRGLETSGTQTWETEKNPLSAPGQYGLESLRVATYWCLALLATYWYMRMCPTHGGWWKQNKECMCWQREWRDVPFKHVQSVWKIREWRNINAENWSDLEWFGGHCRELCFLSWSVLFVTGKRIFIQFNWVIVLKSRILIGWLLVHFCIK